ncbi:uncharacterized protein BKA78DRAFT_299149 [Phyllosticta capitalensis]|uniref:uncharacterized protein n=1 Tax=Phyllosticta capitalensis TaxID=121624 RepID=UPI0031310BAB
MIRHDGSSQALQTEPFWFSAAETGPAWMIDFETRRGYIVVRRGFRHWFLFLGFERDVDACYRLESHLVNENRFPTAATSFRSSMKCWLTSSCTRSFQVPATPTAVKETKHQRREASDRPTALSTANKTPIKAAAQAAIGNDAPSESAIALLGVRFMRRASPALESARNMRLK